MRIAIVGGGIVGLFAAHFLEREGEAVTIYDPETPGFRSVHAAGIIEPSRAYRTNTFSFLRRVGRYLRSGTCTLQGVDPRWLVESLRQLGRPPAPRSEETLLSLARHSVSVYQEMAAQKNDFSLAMRGLLERYANPVHFREERSFAFAHQAVSPVEAREAPDGSGSLFFPEVGWLHTERFVARILRELGRTEFRRARVDRVDPDGTLVSQGTASRFDRIVVCSGVTSRRLGLPLTGVRGFGWHLKVREGPSTATILVDQGIALVPFDDGIKATGGWDFDLSSGIAHATHVLEAIRANVAVEDVVDFNHGSRPCTPDGLPVAGRKEALVVSNGGFRLGWSFAPALGREAARLALGQSDNDPFLARFCGGLKAGPLA